MPETGRGICPFSHDFRVCYPECALYAEAVGKCSFYVSAMLLEDLQKIAVISYEKFVREEEVLLQQHLAEMAKQEAEVKAVKETMTEEK